MIRKEMSLKHNTVNIAYLMYASIIIALMPIIAETIFGFNVVSTGSYAVITGIVFVIQTLFMVMYYFMMSVRRFNIHLLATVLVYIIFSTITLLISVNNASFNSYDIIFLIARIITLVTLLLLPSTLKMSDQSFLVFHKLIVFLVLAASLYNFISNFNGILNVRALTNSYLANFSSFYLNRNTFGQLLWLGSISNTILFLNTQKRRYGLIVYFVIIINTLLTFSRTALIIVIIILVVVSVRFSKLSIKFIAGYIGIFIGFILISQNHFIEIVKRLVIRRDAGASGRFDLWSTGINAIGFKNIFFGVGYFSGTDFIRELGNELTEFHSFYVETLVGGGIFDLIWVLAILLSVVLRLKYVDYRIKTTYYLAFFTFLLYSLFESTSFFNMGYVSTLFTIYFISIPIMYTNYKKSEIESGRTK